LQLRAAVEHNLAVIDGIGVSVSPGTMMVLRKAFPDSGLEGKFSMEYCVAAALSDGAVTLGTFTDEAVARPQVRRLMSSVTVSEDRPPADVSVGGTAAVRAQLRDRTVESPVVEIPRGDPRNALSWEDLSAKFVDCASLVIPRPDARQLIDLIGRLKDIASVRDIADALSPVALTTDH